jgi:hypothetical protein
MLFATGGQVGLPPHRVLADLEPNGLTRDYSEATTKNVLVIAFLNLESISIKKQRDRSSSEICTSTL